MEGFSGTYGMVLVQKKNSEEGSDEGSGYITNITSWWLSFNPFEKDAQVKLDHFPKFSR